MHWPIQPAPAQLKLWPCLHQPNSEAQWRRSTSVMISARAAQAFLSKCFCPSTSLWHSFSSALNLNLPLMIIYHLPSHNTTIFSFKSSFCLLFYCQFSLPACSGPHLPVIRASTFWFSICFYFFHGQTLFLAALHQKFL